MLRLSKLSDEKVVEITRTKDKEVYAEIIKRYEDKLMRYAKSILNDDDKDNVFLDMISAFAFDRKKHIEKRIEYGDGIVGSVAIEKETTYLEDIPEDYISITSGLGGPVSTLG